MEAADRTPRNRPDFSRSTIVTRSTGTQQVHKCQQGKLRISSE